MGAAQKIYKHVPVFLQNAIVSIYGYGWRRRRFGGVFSDQLTEFTRRESYSASQWNDYQQQELRKLLLHAYETVPFYKEKYTRSGFTKERLQKMELTDIASLPFLEKDELRQFGDNTLLSSQRLKGNFYASSGSTGTPTRIYYSTDMHQRWSAGFEARIRHWAGIDRFMPRGMIGGRRVLPDGVAKPPYYRYNSAEKQVYFSAYHISPAATPNYVEAIRKYGLSYMTGYAMSNYFLAQFIDELHLEVPQLKAVITSSEKLTQEMRALFTKVYGCRTYDSWSGVEACGLISECEHGSLHMSPDMAILEVINEDGTYVQPGDVGELVCTGLINYDQPLIRYRIGDKVRLSASKCSCGRDMLVVDEIIGRVEDVVIGKDGRRMVRFHGIFIGIPSIIKGQIIQETLDSIIVKVAVSKKLNEEESHIIKNRMVSQLGDIHIEIQEVDDIPLTANGKFKAVISKVNKAEVQRP